MQELTSVARRVLLRRAWVLTVAGALAVGTTAPAGAQTAPVQECEVPDGTPVLSEGTTETALPQPSDFGTAESLEWVLDLGDAPAGTTATLEVHEQWETYINDWNLEVAAGDVSGVSVTTQPERPDLHLHKPDPPQENVTLHEAEHCATVVVTSVNARAVALGDHDPLTTTLTVTIPETDEVIVTAVP